MTQVIATSYGRPASLALAAAVQAAKGLEPLAPVAVVVPSNFAGLAARRILGSDLLAVDSPHASPDSGAVAGIANVNFFTPFRLAELLAVGQLEGKRPLTNPVLGSAVRQALADEPFHLAGVRDHQATEQAVAAAVGELSNVSAARRSAIVDAGGFAASVVKIHQAVQSRLKGFHDEADVARAATHRPDLAAALAPFGPVIWYLPGVTTAPLARFMGVVCSVGDSTVLIARSGSEDADAQVRRSLRIAGLEWPAQPDAQPQPSETSESGQPSEAGEPSETSEPAVAGHVVSVSDADEEVRQVVREVIGLAAAGVRLDRIGIFHPVPDPYVRLLSQHLGAADIPANGPSRRRLSESIAGRVLLSALSLPGERWRRDRVMALVNSGPVRSNGELVSATTWDTVSRDAGVVIDLADWATKLDAYATRLSQRADDATQHGHSHSVQALERQAAEAQGLDTWLTALAESVDAVHKATSWEQRSAQALALLHQLLGKPHRLGWWPEPELVAYEQVEQAIDRLGALDELEPNPNLATFVRALNAELAVARARSGRYGHGVFFGPLASAVGQDLDAVFVLGCAEGILPAPRREDALLPDKARELTQGDLAPRLDEIHEQRRLFQATLGAAPEHRRWLFFPRGDLRGSRRARPSRWLLPSASRLATRTLYATDFEHETPPGIHNLESHASAIVSADHAGSLIERDLAQVAKFVSLGHGQAIDHPAAASVKVGLAAQAARAGAEFTVFDGNLASQDLPAADGSVWSPSRLESWATCGFRYFLAHVLGIGDRDDPERTVELSALDRGSALHQVLEDFYSEMAKDRAQAPDEPWGQDQRTRAMELAAETFDDYERRGRTGRSVLWDVQRADLLALLGEFLAADDRHRHEHGAMPDRFEQPFGFGQVAPVEIAVDETRRLRFRGVIDRVDVAGGGHMLVSDYKTGSGSAYTSLERDPDPTRGGRLLQLGLYAEAAHQILGAQSVDTRYWMVSARAGYKRMGYQWTNEHRQRLAQVVATIAQGIESGVFAAAPGEWDGFRRTYAECAYCDFDPICPKDRAEHATEKLSAPELTVRVALTTKPEPGDVTQPPVATNGALS